MKRRDDDYVGTKVLEMHLSGKRKRGRQHMMYLDVVKEDMQEVGAREYDVFARSACKNPLCPIPDGKTEIIRRSSIM